MADDSPSTPATRSRTNTTSTIANSIKSTAGNLLQKDPPVGFFAATANAASSAPAITEIRRGSFGHEGWRGDTREERLKRTQSSTSIKKGPLQQSSGSSRDHPVPDERDEHGMVETFPALTEEPSQMEEHERREEVEEQPKGEIQVEEPEIRASASDRADDDTIQQMSKAQKVNTSGYIPPPVVPWTKSTAIGFKAFWKWFCTPTGFLITLYGLNVVAWGGMLFLLLCNASYWMCWAPVHSAETEGRRSPAAALALNNHLPRYYNCNDINSPRRVWLEIDSQILNALFCVTGFGLVPWRFRDLYYLLRWRFTSEKKHGREEKMYGLRVLAGIHQDWFRLPGWDTREEMTHAQYEETLGPSVGPVRATPQNVESGASALEHDLRVPLPVTKTPDDPITEIRAPPTAPWKMDFFVWCQVWNTLFQCCLCGFMWGMNRYDRPSWSTGFFIAIACIIAGVAGFMSFLEGKNCKKIEGVKSPHVEAAAAETLDLKLADTSSESIELQEKPKGRD